MAAADLLGPRIALSASGVVSFLPDDADIYHIRATLSGPPQNRPRWSLALIRDSVDALTEYSLSGVHKHLKRLGIRLKRGRDYIHSPDPEYIAKERRILDGLSEADSHYGSVVLLYGDEMSYYLQPSLSYDYCPAGHCQPLARRACHPNTIRRIVGALDAISGRLIQRQASKINLRVFKTFLKDVRDAYPEAHKLYLVLDNWWNVHNHPQVLEQAEQLGITILFLPTYSPWLNPIEKLWRWLRQEVLHMHTLAENWLQLQAQVSNFLHRFTSGDGPDCLQLLRYVGLVPSKTYG